MRSLVNDKLCPDERGKIDWRKHGKRGREPRQNGVLVVGGYRARRGGRREWSAMSVPFRVCAHDHLVDRYTKLR